jgi:serine/threonine-protein kinase HipA
VIEPTDALNVYLHGQKVAQIESDERGYHLSYDPDVTSPHPLSQALRGQVASEWSMPVHRYKGDAVWDNTSSALGNFLFGLLPDNPDVLSEMSRRYNVEDRNPVELLAHVGVDCVGAVQFTPANTLPQPTRSELSPVSDDQIERALREARTRGVRYEGAGQGVSQGTVYRPGSLLAGFQPKFGLLRDNGQWLRSTPEWGTSHIFKTGIAGRDGQAAFEFLGMRAAAHLGLEVAAVDFSRFGDEDALVIERFDRVRDEVSLAPRRVHQEDLAQLLSVPVFPAQKKYGRDSKRIIKSLRNLDSDRETAHQFVQQLAYNTLIGNADAHLKNYSIRYDQHSGAISMSPLYDCATEAHDPQFHSGAQSPIRIGGTVDYAALQRSSTWWRNLAKSGGLDEGRVLDDVRHLARMTPEAVLLATTQLPDSHRRRVEESGVREAIAEICTNVESTFGHNHGTKPRARKQKPGVTHRAQCGHQMPRAGVPCVAPAGHGGPHRSR